MEMVQGKTIKRIQKVTQKGDLVKIVGYNTQSLLVTC